jgi:hypothetical protein
MINETLDKLEKNVNSNSEIDNEQKEEFLGLLSKLKTEIITIEESHRQDAHNIVNYTDSSFNVATKNDKNKDELERNLNTLTGSIEGFEATHPKLVEIVNSVCTRLSTLGI